MYDSDLSVITSIIGGILSIIVLITFFVMANRLKKIFYANRSQRYQLGDRIFYNGMAAEHLGLKDEAIKEYTTCLYIIADIGWAQVGTSRLASFTRVKEKLKDLGATIPGKMAKIDAGHTPYWNFVRER